MFAYVVRRLVIGIVTVWLVVTALFLIFFVLPGGSGRKDSGGFSSVAVFIAGRNNSPANLRRIEADLGLDEPLFVQYRDFIARLTRGDLGYSYGEPGQRVPVAPMIKASIVPTAQLVVGAALVAIALGMAGGAYSAQRRGRWSSRGLIGASIVTMSVPSFVLGLLLLAFLARFGVYVNEAYRPLSEGVGAWLQGMALPWFVLAFPFIGLYFRLVRSTLLGVENEEFVRTARAKGVDERGVLRHQLRASLIPLVSAYGVDLANFLGGAIIVESIFAIPGLGQLAVGAIRGQDYPVIAAITIVGSSVVILMSMLVDILYTYIDPRIVYAKAAGT